MKTRLSTRPRKMCAPASQGLQQLHQGRRQQLQRLWPPHQVPRRLRGPHRVRMPLPQLEHCQVALQDLVQLPLRHSGRRTIPCAVKTL